MKFFPLIWSALKRKKLRTALTMMSIVVAFVLFGYLTAIKRALSQGVELAGADRLVVRHRVSIVQFLPQAYETRIERIPGVSEAANASWFGGIYQEPRNFFAQLPIDPDEYFEVYPEYVLDAESMERWKSTRTGAVVGRTLADRFDWKIGDRVPIQTTIWEKEDGSRTWEFDIVGIYEGSKQNTDTSQFFFRHDYFEESRVIAKGQIGWYVVKVADPDRAEEIAMKIDEEFANSPAETKTETEGAFVQAFAKQIGDIGMMMIAILSAVFFTILLVAGNTMAQAVRERTQELGVLKAIGFTSGQVMRFVLAESCLLAGLAGLAGLTLAWLSISAGDPTGGMFPMFSFSGKDFAVGVCLMLALGLAAGVFPAVQAMRLRISEALRRD